MKFAKSTSSFVSDSSKSSYAITLPLLCKNSSLSFLDLEVIFFELSIIMFAVFLLFSSIDFSFILETVFAALCPGDCSFFSGFLFTVFISCDLPISYFSAPEVFIINSFVSSLMDVSPSKKVISLSKPWFTRYSFVSGVNSSPISNTFLPSILPNWVAMK